MKFKIRESTDYLYVHKRDTGGLTVPELRRVARKEGKLDIDYHYVVQDTGSVEQGRDEYVVAGHELENNDRSIYVLVDVGDRGRLSDAQKVALRDLISSIQGTYPDIKVIIE